MQHPDLVVVQTCGTRLEADLAMTALQAEDIQSMLQADTAGGMREHLAWSGLGFKILVREEDAQAAREVLAPPAGALGAGAENPEVDLQTDPDHPQQ